MLCYVWLFARMVHRLYVLFEVLLYNRIVLERGFPTVLHAARRACRDKYYIGKHKWKAESTSFVKIESATMVTKGINM